MKNMAEFSSTQKQPYLGQHYLHQDLANELNWKTETGQEEIQIVELSSTDFRITMLNMFLELKKRERILAKSLAENLEHIFLKELKENSRSEKVQ